MKARFRNLSIYVLDQLCSKDFWALFMIVLYFSKYGNLKLGKDDEKPEYPTATWFTMLFACGIGVGLFYYGVAEPIYHYIGPNRYTADPYMTDNLLAQNAINVTFYHYGQWSAPRFKVIVAFAKKIQLKLTNTKAVWQNRMGASFRIIRYLVRFLIPSNI